LIQSLIMNHTLLFVGYSLSDSTFNSIFRMIQNTFKLDAKNAYFYTPEEPSMIIREYYKKQGIFIISNEENLGQETSEKQNKLYCRTKDFLEVLSENRSQDVNNADDLWNQLAFLDRLSFIDAKDFSRYSDLKKRALNWDDEYCWFGNDQLRFEIDGHEELRIMVSKKSLLNRFLDMEIGEPRDLKGNRFLSKAFKLYEEKQYSLAKAKFRELA
ncbi:TPA: SIR2 family protein, partial [Streptococcus pneumoniae]|nr:SIR2 family protein [Streptococcus pneumoniae]